MDERSLLRSRAEILFAGLLSEESVPSANRVQELCAAHPELAPELQRIREQLVLMRSLFPAWAVPGGEHPTGTGPPPDLGAFRCVRLLGRGGMGEVWEAQDLTIGRTVAVKLLRESWNASDKQIQRFQREAQAAGRVQHSGIVTVHQTAVWEGRPYIVQELVPGGRTLRDEIDELHRLPELPGDHARRVAERFHKLADALAAAHAAGIIHRDLKPQNVLLTPAGEPKVADFGLALLASDESLSRSGEFLGTCYYASPEQIEGTKSALDERSDVFSLGATMYENLTLRRAFDGDSVQQVMHAVTLADPPAPHLLRGRVPHDLSLVVMKALEKRPEDRYRSMAELRDELRRFLAHEPVAVRPPSAPRRLLKWSRRHPTTATALALSLGASAALAGLFARSERLRSEATRAQAETAELNRSLVVASDGLRVQKTVAEEVIDFLLGMFAQVSPDVSGDQVPTLREILDRAVRRLESGQVQDHAVRARIQEVLGSVFTALGDGVAARGLLEDALAAWQAQGLEHGPDATRVELVLVNVLTDLVNDLPAAEARIAALLARLGQDPEFDAAFATRIHLSHVLLLQTQGRFEEAVAALERAEAEYRRHPQPELEFELQSGRVRSAVLRGRVEEGRALLEPLVAEQKELLARSDPAAIDALDLLGAVMIQQGLLEDAEKIYLELCVDAERTLDRDHPTVLMFRMRLAKVWEDMGRYDEAESLYRESLALIEEKSGPLNLSVLAHRNNIATCLVRQGRFEEAEPIFRDVWEKSRSLYGESHDYTLGRQHNLAQALTQLGRLDEALTLQAGVVALTPPDDPKAASRRNQLENIRGRMGAQQ